jgi:uncharacterized protein (DUF427 family)
MIKLPGPDHPISIEPTTGRVSVRFNDQLIADTTRALSLAESSYPVVQYIPRDDVRMDLLERTDHTTRCPYKGEASYYSIIAGDRVATNGVWSYEAPNPAVRRIAGLLAFDPRMVDSITIEAPQIGSSGRPG